MCFVCVKSRKSNACSLQFTAPTNRFESVPHTCYWTREKSENRTKKKKERRRRNVDKRRASLRWNESRWLAAQRRRRDGRNDRNGVEYEANEWTASRTPASPSPICQWRPKRRDAPAESKEKDNEMIEWDFFFYRILVSITQKASVFAFRIIFEPFSVNLTALVDEISWLGSNRWTFVKLRSLTFLVSAVTSRISFIKSTGQSFLPFLCKLTSMGYFLRLGLVLQTWSTQFKENTEKTPCLIENFAKKHSNHVFFVNFVSCLRHAIASFLLLVILNLLNTSW